MHTTLVPRSLAALTFTVSFASFADAQSVQESTGYNRLAERLGAGSHPTGAGMLVALVEAAAGGCYAPLASNAEFVGKTITQKSGALPTWSLHASAVAQCWFGNASSIAPGIELVNVYEAAHWLGSGFLNGSGPTPPQMVAAKIFNHSWIGNAGSASNAYLRKLDAVIESQGLVVCAGVNNGIGPLDATLLSHSFNALTVGRSDGLHHAGNTALGVDGPGRMKPDLVAPAGATSFATPLVSGAAALLVETAWNDPHTAGNVHAALPEVIKAVLMAGAQHRAGWSNGATQSGAARGKTSTPLDPVFGADQLDVDRSQWILASGEQPFDATPALAPAAPSSGWSELEIGARESRWVRFHVPADEPYVSIVAAWNRSVAPDYASWSLADLDLELWAQDEHGEPAEMLGTPAGRFFGGGNVLSESAVDNVEHLYVTDLAAGEYLLEVRRSADSGAPARAAVAWDLAGALPQAYGSAKRTSLGTLPVLRSSGMPSSRGGDFELKLSNALPGRTGVAIEGSRRADLPFRRGTLLVAAPILRGIPIEIDATGSAVLHIEITPELVGATRTFQILLRDPAQPDGTGFSASNALEVRFSD